MLEITPSRIWRIAYNQKYWCIFFLFLAISFLINRSLIEPGLILSGDFTRGEFFKEFVASTMYPLWNENGQSSNLPTLHQLGLYTPAIIISSVVDIPTTTIYLVYFLLLASLSGVFSFKLTEYVMRRSNLNPHFEFAFASSLSFIFATFVVETTFHPAIAFSFYLSPLLLYAVIRGVEENRSSYLLLSSLIYSLVAVTLHFVVFGLVIILSYVVYDFLHRIVTQKANRLSALKRSGWYALIVIGPFIVLSSYWLVPNLIYSGQSLYSNLLTANDPEILYRNTDIINVFAGKGFFNLYDVYPYTESELAYINILSIMLTIIAASSLLFFRQNKFVIYLGMLLSLSVIISIIPRYLPELYNWFIFDVQGGSLFSWLLRAPKFYLFMSIPIAIMIGLSGLKIYQTRYVQKKQVVKILPPVFITTVIVFSLVPNYSIITGDFNGHHRSYNLPADYTNLLEYLEEQDGNYKSILGPPYAGLNSTWTNNKIGDLFEEQISPANTFNSIQTKDQYIYPVIFGIRFPYGSIVSDEQTNNVREFLSPINIKYIVLHNDIPEIKDRIDKLSTALDKQEGLESRDFGFTTLYTIQDAAPQFSTKHHTMLIQGGLLRFDSIFRTEAINSDNVGALFSDASMEQNPIMWNSSNILIPENELSYLEYMLHKSDVALISPSDYTDEFAPLNLWSKSSANIQPFLNQLQRNGIELPYQYDYGENIIFTSASDSQIEVPISVPATGEYKVLLRYFANDRGGSIDLHFNEKLLTAETKSQLNRFIWTDLGSVSLSEDTQTLYIENRNGFNAVNLIALIPVENYQQHKEEFVHSIQDKDIIHVFEAESDFNFAGATSRLINDIKYSNGKAVELSPQDMISTRFEILKNDTYDIAVNGEGIVTLDIDGMTKRTIDLVQGVAHIETLLLNPGYHHIEISKANSTDFSHLDSVIISSTSNDEGQPLFVQQQLQQQEPRQEEITGYHKMDPTTYEVNIRAQSPIMLAFAEAYDERWVAEVKTSEGIRVYKPVPLYGAINGFTIDTIGEYIVHIKYAPQEIFYVGLWISAISYTLVIIYLTRVHQRILPRGHKN